MITENQLLKSIPANLVNVIIYDTKYIIASFQVYGLLSLQLTMTTLIAAVCMLTPQIKEGVQSHPGFLLVAFVLSFGLLIGLYVKRKESPINLILLAAFVSICME